MQTLYSVNLNGKPMSCGTLSQCWKYLMDMYGRDARIADVAELGITIEPAPLTDVKGVVCR